MTPAARLSAAIEILDVWLTGEAPEKLLTTWGRQNRYAGSKDRAAIRDIVYSAIRCRRSFARLGGGETGRGLVLGGVYASGEDPAALFTGEGYAPAALTEAERAAPALADILDEVDYDLPEWTVPLFEETLGTDWQEVAGILRFPAGVHLRVNTAKGDVDNALKMLAKDEIVAGLHHGCETALSVTQNPRRIKNSRAYLEGYVELQDAASQRAMAALNVTRGMSVLDYCAGGGGKSLALAAMGAKVTAHDISPARMKDIAPRAARAGVSINTVFPDALQSGAGPYDLVLADAPCSGSGTWNRAPQGKWDLTPARLDELCALQASILDEICDLVAPGGTLAYATCSLFEAENSAQIDAFLARHPGWRVAGRKTFTPLEGGSGFFLAQLTRS